MSDLMGSLTTEMRITGRILRETLLGFKRTGWMNNLLIIITMLSILSIFGVVLAIFFEMRVLVKTVGSELEISAYLKDGTNALQIVDRMKKELPHVKTITIISKEKAWDDMR